MTVGGQKLYFITSPEDVSTFYKNSTTLSVDLVVADVTETFGVSKASVEKFYTPPTSKREDFAAHAIGMDNPDLKELAKLNMIFWHEQLVPGPHYYAMQSKFLDLMNAAMKPENLSGRFVMSSNPDGTKVVSLLSLTEEILVDAAIRAFFGDAIFDLNPNLIEDAGRFDRESWKLWYKYPNAADMAKAKARMLDTVSKWLALPEEKRPGACFLVEQFITTERAVKFPEKDIAEMLCIVIFA